MQDDIPQAIQQQLDELKRELEELKTKQDRDIHSHDHDGNDSQRVGFDYLEGLIETVSAIPSASAVPKTVYDQIKIYVSGATKTLYIYDSVNHAWRSVTLS